MYVGYVAWSSKKDSTKFVVCTIVIEGVNESKYISGSIFKIWIYDIPLFAIFSVVFLTSRDRRPIKTLENCQKKPHFFAETDHNSPVWAS